MHKTLLPKIFILLFLMASCGNGERSRGDNQKSSPNPNPIAKVPIKPHTPLDATVKIYFENTLSMDGYINGNTNFKDVFRELLVAVDNENQIDLETEFYLVNNELTREDFGVENIKISERLNPRSTSNKGNKGSSNFEEILNTVLQNQEGDVISLIMADFIYSPDGQQDTPSALNKLKTYTQDAFLKATSNQKDLETRIYHFTSDFDGTYYDFNNKHIKGVKERPYYYFVIAPAPLMSVFEGNIASQLKKNETYKNEAFFSTEQYNSKLSYNILSSTASNGRIRVMKDEIQIHDYPRQGNLEFTVLLNLKNLPLSDEFITNPSNYQLNNSEFKIKNIGLKNDRDVEFDGQDPVRISGADLISIKNDQFTHAIQFAAEGLVSENLHFALKKTIPAWVSNIHSADDREIYTDSLEQTKTFGFGHLVEGVSNGFIQKGNNDYYFDIEIPVK
jgi:hypothetical protein